MGCADRHLREYVRKTYGDYDPDHDGFCDKWIGQKGLWKAMGNGCNQDYLDECPTEFGGERGCPRQQDNSFARQKANQPNSRQNNRNGLFVNGKKVKFKKVKFW